MKFTTDTMPKTCAKRYRIGLGMILFKGRFPAFQTLEIWIGRRCISMAFGKPIWWIR